jgi:hypothetical protein
MKNLYIICCFFLHFAVFAQLPNGSHASNFTVTDINGGSHSLYDKLSGGRSAIIDFSATWCGPCWNLHQSGILKSVHSGLGAYTSVMFLEPDFATNTDCLYGLSSCSGSGTWGNWVAGTPYPIANLSGSNGGGIPSTYYVAYYPMVYIISPDKRTWEIQDFSFSIFESWVKNSFSLTSTAALYNAMCGSDGRIELNVSGGQAPLFYKWSNGSTDKNLTDIGGGSYSVTITDNNGYFVKYGPYSITGPAKNVEVTSYTVKNNFCYNESKGEIKITAGFGSSPYSFNWSNGATTSTISTLAAGTYTVTITDRNNCTTSKDYVITEPDELITDPIVVDESCNEMDGEVKFETKGGTLPYSFIFNSATPKTTNLFQFLASGKYNYVILDQNKCRIAGIVTIEGSSKPVITTGTKKSLLCTNDTLIIDPVGTDNTGAEIFSWSTKNGKIVSDPTKFKVAVTKLGTYYLHVKNKLTKCENLDSILIVDERKFPELAFEGDSILNCKNQVLTLLGKSKSNNVQYIWGNEELKRRDTVSNFTVLLPGKYYLIVQDTNTLCETVDTIVVYEDKVLPELVLASNQDILQCRSSELELKTNKASIGSQFSYFWSTLNGSIVRNSNALNAVVNQPGIYNLIIQNQSNFCTSTASTTVELQDNLVANFNLQKAEKNISLTDVTIGKVISREWTFGDGNISNEISPVHTFKDYGDYKVCLTVQNDCNRSELCSTVSITPTTSTDDDSDAKISTVLMSPNPATDVINLNIKLNTESEISIEMYNLLNQKVYTYKNQGNNFFIPLNVSEFSSGVYTILIRVSNEVIMKKVKIIN